MKLFSFLYHTEKSNSKWIKNINIREKSLGGGLGNGFLDMVTTAREEKR
jgi:hypothetical protein